MSLDLAPWSLWIFWWKWGVGDLDPCARCAALPAELFGFAFALVSVGLLAIARFELGAGARLITAVAFAGATVFDADLAHGPSSSVCNATDMQQRTKLGPTWMYTSCAHKVAVVTATFTWHAIHAKDLAGSKNNVLHINYIYIY